MPACYVFGCKTNTSKHSGRRAKLGKNETTDPKTQIKVLPKDPILRAKWIRSIERADKKITEENAHNVRVCFLHFAEDDFILKKKQKAVGYRTDIRPDAVPCIFPNQPSYKTKVTKRRKDPLERENVVMPKRAKKNETVKKEVKEVCESSNLEKHNGIVLNPIKSELAKDSCAVDVFNVKTIPVLDEVDEIYESAENTLPDRSSDNDKHTNEDKPSIHEAPSVESIPTPLLLTFHDIKAGLDRLQLPGADWGMHINGKGYSEFICLSRMNDEGIIDRSLTLNTFTESGQVSATFKVHNRNVPITGDNGPLIITSLDKLSQILKKISNLNVCSGISCNSTNFSNTCSLLIGESEIICNQCEIQSGKSEEVNPIALLEGQKKQFGGLGQHFMAGW